MAKQKIRIRLKAYEHRVLMNQPTRLLKLQSGLVLVPQSYPASY